MFYNKMLNKLLFQLWSIVDCVLYIVYSLKETCVLFCVLHPFFFLTSFLFKFSVLILTATFIKNIGLITKLYPFYMQGFVYFS